MGHPAFVAHVFGPRTSKLWMKLDQPTMLRAFYYFQLWNTSPPYKGMLYLGDTDEWKETRKCLGPYFRFTDFSNLESKLKGIVQKHLGEEPIIELFQVTHVVTTDMLCQVLYGCELPQDELEMLARALVEFTIPNSLKSTYGPHALNANDYHKKVANEMADKSPERTLAYIIRNQCPTLSQHVKYENIGFFTEALTPAFAATWSIANICLKGVQQRCLDDPTFRSQCIKESMRMYPPVPVLWPRMALKDHYMDNPLYDDKNFPHQRWQKWSLKWLYRQIFGVPIEEQPKIKIKKGTKLFFFPSVLHYDDRFWDRPDEFIPERWNNNEDILGGRRHAKRSERKQSKEGENSGDEQYTSATSDTDESNSSSEQEQHSCSNPQQESDDDDDKTNYLMNMAIGAELGTFRKEMKRQLHPFHKMHCGGKLEDVPDNTLFHCVYRADFVRSLVFGVDHELNTTEALVEDMLERNPVNLEELKSWSYLPFASGPHTCLGRRLAVHMVDAIVTTFLEYKPEFMGGFPPSMMTRKPWYQRCTSFLATYNYPTDLIGLRITPPLKKKET